MSVATLGAFLGAWSRAKRAGAFHDRTALEALQARWLERHLGFVAQRSPFYRAFAGKPLADWPVIDKREWMDRFDDINTVGAQRAPLEAFAARAESSRDFSATWNGYTAGLSTGTSGNRGLFFVSPVERAQWAGTMLARMLRPNPLREERLALALRAGSGLYDRASTLRVRFRYFDQLRPWDEIVAGLVAWQPTVLIAPARVLALLAAEAPRLAPRRVISVAEVLDDLDRARITTAFGVRVEQIYQATEGLLGTSCEHGTVHLMEPHVIVEPEWLDAAHTRFTPRVTDLWRRTQPVIRFRMNDVLRVRETPCPCGRAALGLDAIDGRFDDLLWLDGERGRVCMFPDLLTREIVLALPGLRDYRVRELARGAWRIDLAPLPAADARRELTQRIAALTQRLGAPPPRIEFAAMAPEPLLGKQRRVRAAAVETLACAS